jgi:hypothetical protein
MNLLISTIIPGIISFFLMRKEKSAVPEGQVDESPLSGSVLWYVFILCLLAPLIAQTIFYYGWKKRLPKKAKKANNLGWLAILLWIGGSIAINILR